MKNNLMQALWSASAKVTVKSALPQIVENLKIITSQFETVAKILQDYGTADRGCASMRQTLSSQIKILESVAETLSDICEVLV